MNTIDIKTKNTNVASKQSSPLKAIVASIVRDNCAEPRVLRKSLNIEETCESEISQVWIFRTQVFGHWVAPSSKS